MHQIPSSSPTQMDFLIFIFALLLSYTLIQIFFLHSRAAKQRSKTLPPGPTPLPIIGNLHLLGNHPHRSLAELAKQHGPIMFLHLGRINTLVISSAAAAKMVLQKQDLAFSARYIPDAVHTHNHFHHSVVWLPVGNQWRRLRKILNTNIFSGSRLDNGLNKRLRSQKVYELIAYCRKASKLSEAVDIGEAAFRTTINILSNNIFSRDLITDQDEDSCKEFKEVAAEIMETAGKPNLVDFFPVLKKVDPQGIRRKMDDNFEKLFKIFEGLINERLELRKMGKGGGEYDDVLEILLNASEHEPEEIERSCIKSLCTDLFVAGTDTTTGTLEWAMAELLRNPQTMAKAKEELNQVIGKSNILEEHDVLRLPYLQCIVKETLRLHTPVPLLLPRKVETDVKLDDYMIPKGTQVFVNAWAIGRDSNLWQDPSEFKPERFLTLELDVKGFDFELIPFGAGRRICPGLPLASRMVSLILGSLLNNFDWKLEDDIEPNEMDMTEKSGITLQKAKPLHAIPIHVA